jgi:hypothetical protein
MPSARCRVGACHVHSGQLHTGRTRAVDRPALVVGSMLDLWRLLCCVHPQDNAGKIGPSCPHSVDPGRQHRSGYASCPTPRPAPSPPVQDDHQIPRDRVGSDPLWCDAVGGIQIADHVRVPFTILLRQHAGKVEVQRRRPLMAA